MVYSASFDPELTQRSLGNFLILDHMRQVRSPGLSYVYLGYWVKDSPKMAYKGSSGRWRCKRARSAGGRSTSLPASILRISIMRRSCCGSSAAVLLGGSGLGDARRSSALAGLRGAGPRPLQPPAAAAVLRHAGWRFAAVLAARHAAVPEASSWRCWRPVHRLGHGRCARVAVELYRRASRCRTTDDRCSR